MKQEFKLITEGGVYRDLPMEQYHSDCCAGPSVSSTVLRQSEIYSLRHGWLQSHLNPDREFNPAKHFRIGTALHSLALEGELSKKHFALSPYDEFRTKEAKDWRDKRLNEGKTVLKQTDVDKVKGMLESLLEEPVIQAGLFDENGELECSLIHKDEETGLWLKARPDVVPTNDMQVDLKSCADARLRAVRRSIEEYGYYMQLALSDELYEKVLGIKMKTHAFVFIESEPPYAVSVAELDEDFIAWGRVQNRRAMRRFADCLSKGVEARHFPKYENAEYLVSAPPWLSERLTKEQDAGLLPKFFETGYTGG